MKPSAHAAKFDHVVGVADYRSGQATDVAGFKTPDANTFVVELDQPNAAFISSISWPLYAILPAHTLGSVDIRDRDATVQIVQAQLQAVGMKVELNPVEAGPLTENHKNRTFDLSLYGGGLYTIDGDSTSVPNQRDQAYPAGGNNAHYCNPEVDAAFARARSTSDVAQRNQAYQQIARIQNDEVPYIWLYVPSAIWAYSGKLQNFKPHGELTYGFWNASEWR